MKNEHQTDSQEQKPDIVKPQEEGQGDEVRAVEILDLDDDLDTGMHRVNVCKSPQ